MFSLLLLLVTVMMVTVMVMTMHVQHTCHGTGGYAEGDEGDDH